MLNTISQEKAALAIIPDHLAEKKGSDDTEKDKGNCIIVLRQVILQKNAGKCMDVL